MEELILKTLPSLGSAGILSAVLWIIADRFMKETIKQMSARIDALEKAADDCMKDRRTLHQELVGLFKKIAVPNAKDE